MSNMGKYYITADVVTTYGIEVEAESPTEATKIANRISLNDWETIEDQSFEIQSITGGNHE